MAAPAGYYADATKGPTPGYEKAAKAIRAIQAANAILLDDADLQYYVALDQKNVDLAARNQTLESDLESQDRRIGSLLRQRDDAFDKLNSTDAKLENTNKEKEALVAKLAAAQEALREKEKKVASREAEFAKEKAALRRELDSGRDTLGKLKDFSIELKPVADNAREMWAKSLPSQVLMS
jgi:chromosome segregation ATPase